MAKKMSKGVVALSSAAILSVYGIGYALTQPAAGAMAAGQGGSAAPAQPSVSTNTPNGGSGADAGSAGVGTSPAETATATSRPAVAPSISATSPQAAAPAGSVAASSPGPSPTSTSGLTDGTYTGSGMSRHGGVNVKVVIQNGKIISAAITGTSTRYSPNVISSLPGQVVAAQSANVNLVSGATDSSDAYVQAVAQALSQAGGSGAAVGASTGVQVTGPRGSIYSNGGRGRGGFNGN
jgi:uncharacterized protein with FMN-binding domain